MTARSITLFRLLTAPAHSFFDIDGMSGWRYRLFINQLVRRIQDPRYLEVGSWKGSTLCSAISGNDVTATAIDNWAEFGGPRDEFIANMERERTPGSKINVIEMDFRQVEYGKVGKHNIYLFDGPHLEQDQYDGLCFVAPSLDDEFILIIDDWNYPPVAPSTLSALRDMNWTIQQSVEIRTTFDGSIPEAVGQDSEWHNGYFIGVIRKGDRLENEETSKYLTRRNATYLNMLRTGGYDFIDIGTHHGAGFNIGHHFGGKRGLGFELNPEKSETLVAQGIDCVCCDINTLSLPLGATRWSIMNHILEHLPNAARVGTLVDSAASCCSDFLYIACPFFDSENYLYEHHLTAVHSLITEHTCRFTTVQFANILSELGLRDFFIAGEIPITDSADTWLHRSDAPDYAWSWEPRYGEKPEVIFDRPAGYDRNHSNRGRVGANRPLPDHSGVRAHAADTHPSWHASQRHLVVLPHSQHARGRHDR